MRGFYLGLVAAFLVLSSAFAPEASGEYRMPKPDRMNVDQLTTRELEDFYTKIKGVSGAEELDRIMHSRADECLYHAIDKRQLRSMWLEIFSDFSDRHTAHMFSEIEVYGDDAILTCTVALLGIPVEGAGYEANDRWLSQNHWLSGTMVSGR